MANLLREYVAALDHDTCIQIIKDQEQFEQDGYIGDCALREHAQIIKADILNASGTTITLWMDRLVFEVYRRFTYEMNQLMIDGPF